MTSTMQLEFSQAMSDFKTMFPDMDREVIEAVLRANQGAVDATIDQLLAMSTDNQNEKLRNELDAITPQLSLINLNDSESDLTSKEKQTDLLIDTTDGSGITIPSNVPATVNTTAAAAANAMLLNLSSSTGGGGGSSIGGGVTSPLHHHQQHQQHHNTGASPKQRPPGSTSKTIVGLSSNNTVISSTPSRRHRRWNPPILGPLPAGFLRIQPIGGGGDGSGAPREFDLPDEQFALMLQNEEFMNQLRWNQEFMNALEKEQCGKAKTEDDAAFKERLKHMGKVSRKKFLQMARVFTWQRNKKVTTAKQIDSLPLKEEPSDDEDHQHHHHHAHASQQSRK